MRNCHEKCSYSINDELTNCVLVFRVNEDIVVDRVDHC